MTSIRLATVLDAEAISTVKRHASLDAYGPFCTPEAYSQWAAKRASVDFIEERILAVNASPRGRFVVAERDGVVVGAGLVKSEVNKEGVEIGYLADVYVFPAGQGVGSAIVNDLLAYSATVWPMVRCFVIGNNVSAVEFFSAKAFVETSRQPNDEMPGELVEMQWRV